MVDPKRLESLFHSASDLPPAERGPFLDRECGGDDALRSEVESLLAAEDQAERFLDTPAPEAFADWSEEELAGRRVGRYRLIRRIESGGMGTVFEAEQDEPRRRVALKLLRRGLLDERALRRFRAESEILARLRHPGVAQVLEAGVGTVGEQMPWFAMEFVPGAQDILQWVENRQPALADRVRLFLEICEAVHHGHQKGVIHRDLKPSNVLVDDQGRAKVIDFGVARVIDDDQRTLLTGHGELVGTLQYMSPEQCAGDPDLVDVRSDVYSLGLILYEMVCGQRAYDIGGMSLAAAVRVVMDQVPPRPSRVARDIPTDLEAVIHRTLDKDPTQRYPAVSALSADLNRYLRHEPVEARIPGPWHALRLFARRHPAVVGSLVVLLVATVVSVRFAFVADQARAAAERDASTRAEMYGFVLDLFERADPSDSGNLSVRELLEGSAERIESRLAEQPAAQLELLTEFANVQQKTGMNRESLPLVERILELNGSHRLLDHTTEAMVHQYHGRALAAHDRDEEAEAAFHRAIRLGIDAFGETDPNVAAFRTDLANFLVHRGRNQEAQELLDQVLETLDDDRTRTPIFLAVALASLGRVHFEGRDLRQADHYLTRAIEMMGGPDGRPTESLAQALNLHGLVLKSMGRLAAALDAYRHSLELYRELIPEDTRTLALLEFNLGVALRENGNLAEADALFQKLRELHQRQPLDSALAIELGCQFILTRLKLNDTAVVRDEAWNQLVELEEIEPRPVPMLFGRVRLWLGMALTEDGELADGREQLEQAIELLRIPPVRQDYLEVAWQTLLSNRRQAGDEEGAAAAERRALDD